MTISFLASHGGSAAKQIIDAVNQKIIHAQIGVIITNNSQSNIFEWCRTNEFPFTHISSKTHPDYLDEDRAIYEELKKFDTDLVVLSGYMKKIGPLTLSHFSGKILNIHPSLLPKHGGKGMYGDRVHYAVLKSGDQVSGASVQIINEEYDDGPVLTRKEVPVYKNDSLESLKSRVQSIEGDLYIDAIKGFYK